MLGIGIGIPVSDFSGGGGFPPVIPGQFDFSNPNNSFMIAALSLFP